MNPPMQGQSDRRAIRIGGGRKLEVTPVFDTYWRFAAARQEVFAKRVAGKPGPWTDDKIITGHRFTNAYRASDRVSQYLIRNVIYDGLQDVEEVFFRTLLFKMFNRVDTWELLTRRLGERPSWKHFKVAKYERIFDQAMSKGQRLYSAAYIMPSPPFGKKRKHANHLQLLDRMMRDEAPRKVATATSLKSIYDLLLSYPSLGGFLAFQFTIDLNYSALTNFSEMDFVVAGPGARNGIAKCFADTAGLSEAEIIQVMAERADDEFDRLGLRFQKLGGKRPLQLIDCQNLFCETDKYARVAHPEITGGSARTRIKQKFSASAAPLPQFYPPKWELNGEAKSKPRLAPKARTRARDQLALALSPAE
jgi:hypothetical protein